MKHLPTTKQLRYLVALDKYQHFGKAAEACFVTQSAFSVAIKELETLLNVTLVDRTNRSVTVTPLGKQVVAQARLTLFDIEGLLDIAQGGQLPLHGELKMGVIPTIAPFLLPRVLPKIRKKFPELELYLTEDLTKRIHQALLEGELDILLLALPYDLAQVETQILFEDSFSLVYNKNTKLIDPENISLNKLNADNVMLLDDGHCMRDHALAACKLKRLNKPGRFAANGLYTLIQMVNNDLGVTFVPEMAIKGGLLKNTNLAANKTAQTGYREIGLAWRKGSVRGEEFKLLGETIRDAVSNW